MSTMNKYSILENILLRFEHDLRLISTLIKSLEGDDSKNELELLFPDLLEVFSCIMSTKEMIEVFEKEILESGILDRV